MTNWVYPLGTAADSKWDVSIGTSDSSFTVDGWAHTGLKVASVPAGAAVELPAADEERIVVPLNGSFTVTVDGTNYPLNGRPSVFSGPSDVLYSGTGRAVSISSADGGRVAVATAPAKAAYPTRLVTAAETPVELRGAGNCSRQVHNFGTPAALEADRFIVCEVLTPAGTGPPTRRTSMMRRRTARPPSKRSTTSRRRQPQDQAPPPTPTPSATSASTPRTSAPSMFRRKCAPATSSWFPMAGTVPPWPRPATTCTT